MSFNTFGRFFRITTFGESHGPAIGAVIDGVPPRIKLDIAAIQAQLARRRPGQNEIASPRKEPDEVQVLSGLFEGLTTGAPLCLLIGNVDAQPGAYAPYRFLFRPGHADQTYFLKYGIRDYRGGGRSSGRETAARVAAGAVARQVLAQVLASGEISIIGHVIEAAGVRAEQYDPSIIEENAVRCADAKAAQAMLTAIAEARQEGDSVGGIVEVRVQGVPAGWGDPVFGKLDAVLASAMMSIGAVKGVEIGDGFSLARMKGSQANDEILQGEEATNHAGGILGGISNGAEIVVRLAVKPTPSIHKSQRTLNEQGQAALISMEGRHDACIAPRLVPVAEAMMALVLADACLAQKALSHSS